MSSFPTQTLAPAKPRLNWPTALTILRILLVPVFLYFIIRAGIGPDGTPAAMAGRSERRYTAVAVFLVMGLTDLLDGQLARWLHQTSRLGAILDPVADKVLLTCSLFVLGFSSIAPAHFAIPWAVIIGAYLKDFGVALGALVVYFKAGSLQVVARWPGKFCTVAQITLVFATLLMPDLIRWSAAGAAVTIWSLWWLVVLTATIASMDYARQGALQVRATR